MQRSGAILWFLIFCIYLAGCGDLRALSTASPGTVYPGWHWRSIDSVGTYGWSPAKLAEAHRVFEAIGSAVVLVVDRGVVIAAWGDVTRKYRCHSMRKSLISALYGIASDGRQVNLEATLSELGVDDNPPALTPIERTATVEDLLKARSGIYHAALSESPEMKARRPARHSHSPGTFWYYNNWDFNALGTIYERAVGKGVFDAFYQEIALPIGMEDYAPSDGRYKTGPESIHLSYLFRMSARDLARFGLLYLRQGYWKGRRLLPSEWIDTSTRSHSIIGPHRGYGYMWWTVDAGGKLPNIRIPETAYFAAGYRGHRMMLFPERDLLIVHRVNTDLPDSGAWFEGQAATIDNRRIGRLLWKLLDAAGMQSIGPDPSWSVAPGERLGGDAIRGILLSKTIEMENGMRFKAYADGRCAIFRQGQVLEKGRWWVVDDLFCSRWRRGGRSALRRYRLALEGTILRRYETDGTLAGVGRLVE